MRKILLSGVVSAASLWTAHAEHPEPPSAAAIAKLLGVPEGQVTRHVSPPPERGKGKMLWTTSYQFKGKKKGTLALVLFADGSVRQEMFDQLRASPSLRYERIERETGDVLHHFLVDHDTQGETWGTTFVTGENDWDFLLTLNRPADIKRDALPFVIDRDGKKLAPAIETLLRGNPEPAPDRAE